MGRAVTSTYLPELPLDLIDVPNDRARALDPVWVEALAAIIAGQGLIHPITVRESGARYKLVAGRHRFAAMLTLGRVTIPARLSAAASNDEARLEEVMENLGRNDLIALDRCHHLHELKQVWERMYPQVKHGGDRKSIKRKRLPLDPDQPEIFGFARATAEKIGLSERAIKLAVTIWTRLTPASRLRLTDTDLARKQTELKVLSEQKPAMQAKILDLILGDAPVENVAQALEYLQAGAAPSASEKRFIAVRKALDALDDSTFDAVVAAHEDRVIASLQRRGRI